MRIAIGFMLLSFLSLSLPTFGLDPRHDCFDYCAVNDATCHGAWGKIHDDHDSLGICSNGMSFGPAALEGYCFMSWTSLRFVIADTTIDCRSNTCAMSGSMQCGGSRQSYAMSCTEPSPGGGGLSDAPQASAGYNFARCETVDGSVTTITCDQSSGQLVTFQGSN